MTSDWMTTRLGDICTGGGLIQTGPFGSQLHARDYVESGVPVIMPVNIADGSVDATSIARVKEEDAARLARHRVQPGDIVYSRRGDITRRALVGQRERGWLCGTGCLLVRPGGSVDPNWLTYWLAAPWTHEYLIQHSVGATMRNLNTGILASVPVDLPPLDVQRRIAGVLGSLDDLIDTDTRIVSLLSDARTRIVDAALRRNGRTILLSKVSEHLPGKYLPKDRYEAGGPYTVFGSNSIMGSHEDFLYDGPFTVLARIGANCGALALSVDAAWVNNNASAIRAVDGQPPFLLDECLRRLDMEPHRGGTGQPFIRVESLMATPIPWLEDALLGVTESRLRLLGNAARDLVEERDRLRQTRDELLPLLMSGRVIPGEVA